MRPPGRTYAPRVAQCARTPRIAPSILSADFARLADEVGAVAPAADSIHVDVMDGHFVPQVTIGPIVVHWLRRHTECFLDCHLMVDEPGAMLDDLVAAGANGATVHVEAEPPRPHLRRIREGGMQAGLAISPETQFEAAIPYLEEIDLLLVMSVVPGRSGQAFLPEALGKLEAARREIDARGLSVAIQVDGGINGDTAPLAFRAGADILVAGSAIFDAADRVSAAHALRDAALR